MLALILAMGYGYWYMTNDTRIRGQAEKYLSMLTGGRVRVHDARFRLFGGVELEGVSVRIRGERHTEPFFTAKAVVLRHRPWALFVQRRLQPTEIVCIDAEVNANYNSKTNEWNFMKLLPASRREGSQGGFEPMDMPTIRVPDGVLRVFEVTDGSQVRPREVEAVPLNLSMLPKKPTGDNRFPSEYQIVIEEESLGEDPSMGGQLELNLMTGEITGSGQFSIRRIREVLPERYRLWLQRYGIAGEFKLSRQKDDHRGGNVYELEMEDFSIHLPPHKGGLEMVGVNGKLTFEETGVKLNGITGQISQAGGGAFTIFGDYEGYEPDSPFSVTLVVVGMTVPKSKDLLRPASATTTTSQTSPAEAPETNPLVAKLRRIHETYQPSGPLNASITVRRKAKGARPTVTGRVQPQGMAILFKDFPYRLTDLRGSIRLDTDNVEIVGVSARHGSSAITLNGSLGVFHGREEYDVRIVSEEVDLDEDLHRALPEGVLKIWDYIDPAGTGAADVRLFRTARHDAQQMDVTLEMKGKTSICCQAFPYRLENLRGRVRVVGNQVRVEDVSGGEGMSCTVNGQVDGLDSDEIRADLKIAARRLPLDEKLANALGRLGKAALEALNPSGQVSDVEVRVTHDPDKGTDYEIVADLADVTVKPEVFPYEITHTSGTVTIRPGRVIVDTLRGRHAKTPIEAKGVVHLHEKDVGLDMHFSARDVRFDKDLADALEPRLKKVWRQLSPAGQGDISLTVRKNTPERPKELDYELDLLAKGMEITYSGFPYTFCGIRGRAIARPGRIELKPLTFGSGKMKGCLHGTLSSDDKTDRSELTIEATGVPIDAALLAAMPENLSPLTSRVKIGGTCNLSIAPLTLVRKRTSAATMPASAPAGLEAPASPVDAAPAAQTTWAVKGSVALLGAMIDLGLGYETLFGTVAGSAQRTAEGLGLQAGINLKSIAMGRRRLTDLSGRLLKRPASPRIRVNDLSAWAHGGQLAGRAEIELSHPPRIGVSLAVKGIRLDDLFNAGVTDPDKRVAVKGLLDGNVQFTATAGKKPTRQATGVLRIGKAELVKLPVFLELLHVIYLTLPGDSAFTDAFVEYHLRGQELLFREIHLDGPALSLVGSGTMDMKTRALNLNFLSGPPGKMPRIRSLADELFEGLAREIAEIRVTGTARNPITKTVALPSLEDAVRRLVRPGSSKK